MVDSNVAKDPKKPRPYFAKWPKEPTEYERLIAMVHELKKMPDKGPMFEDWVSQVLRDPTFSADEHLIGIFTNRLRRTMQTFNKPAGKPTGDEWQKRGGQLMYTDNP